MGPLVNGEPVMSAREKVGTDMARTTLIMLLRSDQQGRRRRE